MSSIECVGQGNKGNSFQYLKEMERITYTKIPFSERLVKKEKSLDLRDMEYVGSTVSASFYSKSDSLFLGLFDDELRWYSESKGKLSCYKKESPLLKIKYVIPKLTMIKQDDWEGRISQSYEASGLYCGKDSVNIAGSICFEKTSMNYIFLPSLDTLKNVFVMNRKDNYWVKSVEKESCALNVIEKLYYADSEVSTPYYNGNISSQIWKNTNDGIVRGYAYSYDNTNRLTSAIYGEGTELKSNRNRYTESVSSYDKNSSILSLQRYGKDNSGSYGLIDDLRYDMDGNQVRSITDKAGRLLYTGSFDFKQVSTDEYTYDANGALLADPNKKIHSISYDYLGYPKTIHYENGNSSNYDYSSNGEKLGVLHQTGISTTISSDAINNPASNQVSIVSQTDYVGDVVYEQGIPTKIIFDGGYYSFSDNLCHYFTRDHLGSIRTMVDENGVLEQSLHYYPLGGIYGDVCYNGDLQNLKYNGKELERMHGLDWYDYGERSYDAAKVGWDRMDKLCESYYHLSPYGYCGGNPIRYIDKDGKKIEFAPGTSEAFKNYFAMAVNYLKEHKVDGILAKLQKSDKVIYVKEVQEGKFSNFFTGDATIYWAPTTGVKTQKGHKLSPTTILNHEADHALAYVEDPEKYVADSKTTIPNYGNIEEKRAVSGFEQTTAKALGEIKEGEVTRTDHYGTVFSTYNPTSTEVGSPDLEIFGK